MEKPTKRSKEDKNILEKTKGSCSGCSRECHRWKDCRYRLVGHPDANSNPTTSWVESEKGKARATHTHFSSKMLPGRWTLGREMVTLKGEASRSYALIITSDGNNLHTLLCNIITHKNDNPGKMELLVDAGCIHMNLISRQCAKHLILEDGEIREGKR